MKKSLLTISIILLILGRTSFINAQECLFGQIEPILSDNPTTSYSSQFGWYVPASGSLRILVIFGEINYHCHQCYRKQPARELQTSSGFPTGCIFERHRLG